MSLIFQNNTIDVILNAYKGDLGIYYEPYRNHVYRVFNFCLCSDITSQNEIQKLAIASAFHDIGIWTNSTFDYLKPSIKLARDYCIENNLNIDFQDDIDSIIENHHKMSAVKNRYLSENFREADLIDLSLGIVKKGRNKIMVNQIRKKFPNKGFHVFLLKIFFKNLVTNPLHPFPIFKL
ncbi:HD domain-containing protein [Flavobacterium sp. MC2016-06]|uniref:HD domain-containing protein n=1 Tax=Flavobacterium sp. MC2016-06 TaxID=2676308 RepID=UPI0012BAE0AC|nr:HD domain-containing protein [Flavobacterium sp. MC2016-06]MBU3860414.1 HD domain-containing protein [Flavobacterium sp. MC2016-06]